MHEALVGILLTGALAGEPPRAIPAAPPGDSTAAVDRIFRWATAETPGCAVAVARAGRTVVARAYGLANLEYGVPNTTATIFETGSVAKQFTAAAVVLLALDGRLSLDDPVRRYVPELPAYAAAVTIRQLLHQTSGVPDWTSVTYIGGRALVGTFAYTNAHALDLVVRQQALNFAPGTEWLYSNSNYILAAVVVERVSGMSLADFTRRRLFEPLGMSHTEWRDDYRRTVRGRATAYAPASDGRFLQNMPFQHSYGPGGMLTTVEDLLTWNEALSRATVGGPQLPALMTTPARLASGREVPYAFGLSVARYRGVPAILHDGGTGGYRAYLARFPEQQLSVALLCNSAGVDPSRLGGQVADVFLAGQLPAAASPMVPAPAIVSVPVASLARVAGLYRDTLLGTPLRADLRDATLVLQNTGPLRPLSPTTFLSGSGAVRVEFAVDAGGRATHLRRTHETDGTTMYARVEPWGPTADALRAFIGRYSSAESDGRYAVSLHEGALALRLSPTLAGALVPVYRDAFTFGGWLLLRFQRDARGDVVGLVAGDVRVRAVPFREAAVKHSIAHVALIVREYDEAIAFYTEKLGFTVVEDTYQPAQDKRWVVIAPAGAGGTGGTSLLLARASSPEQARCIGDQAGGRVFLFLRTDDFWHDYARMRAAGVTFVRLPMEAPYGTVAVFEDLYGNRWDLVEFPANE